MRTIQILDKTFEIFITGDKIQKSIERIAERLNKDFAGKKPLFLVILNGAFMFAGDLFKRVNIDCEISFVRYASYSGTASTNQVKELIGVNENVRGRIVVVVEDIVDTGLTMESLMKELKIKEAKDVKIASLLFKPDAFIKDFKIDYVGMEIPNDFIVGFGLDYNGIGRNYPDIYKVKK
jgi:hypoxanthine phosphoribosyltransferase